MYPSSSLVLRWPLVLLVLLLSAGTVPGGETPAPADTPPQALAPEQALKKARVQGKYAMLLRQFKAPQDAKEYADFRDLGARDVKQYAGLTDLPKGYWVYVYPYWYVWRDLAAAPQPKRPWGPEQATGPPDTHQAGDIQTAWASRTPDDQDEWLLLEYAEPVVPEAVLVYETFNPGALRRVTVFGLDGQEIEVWKGKDPTPRNAGMGTSEVKFRAPGKTNRVCIYLDSKNVPGWNEIDAVGLRDTAGKVHWAVRAEASSTYAQGQGAVRVMILPGGGPQPVPVPVVPVPPGKPAPRAPAPAPAPLPIKPAAPAPAPKTAEERIKKLEDEVRDLKKAVEDLKQQLGRKR